jgi:hypothetical protein
MAYDCPNHCGNSVQRWAPKSRWLDIFGGIIGMMLFAALGKFECPSCGLIPKKSFHPKVRRKMWWGSFGLAASTVAILLAIASYYALKNKPSIPHHGALIFTAQDQEFTITFPENYLAPTLKSANEDSKFGTITKNSFYATKNDGNSEIGLIRYKFPGKMVQDHEDQELASAICTNLGKNLIGSQATPFPSIQNGQVASCTTSFENKTLKSGKGIVIDKTLYAIIRKPYAFVFTGVFVRDPSVDAKDLQRFMNSMVIRD